jgi:endonuclease/exonuclease/phosphatase family metal-dependent hydrolase
MPELTIASFNAHGGVLPRPMSVPRLWDRRRRRPPLAVFDVGAVIEGLDADVVVVQEAYHPDEGDCEAELAAVAMQAELFEVSFGRAVSRPWPHVTRRLATEGSAGLAVLTRFPVLDRNDLPLARVPGDPARRRRALHLTLEVDGQPVELVALHLSSRLPYGPPYQIRRLAPRLPPPGRPAIVAGDFNFWGPAVTMLLPGWQRTVRGRTWPAHRPHSQIDHVLVRGLETIESEVRADVGSDHLPVRVRLRF